MTTCAYDLNLFPQMLFTYFLTYLLIKKHLLSVDRCICDRVTVVE